MASKRRNPGAGGTRVSKTHRVGIRNSANNSQVRTGAQSVSCASTRRSYAVYDGRAWLGTIIWNEANHKALAWDAERRFVGWFDSVKTAAQAIGKAATATQQATAARRRLDDPSPPFASGLSERFLGRAS
jgi:hypothetical protein